MNLPTTFAHNGDSVLVLGFGWIHSQLMISRDAGSTWQTLVNMPFRWRVQQVCFLGSQTMVMLVDSVQMHDLGHDNWTSEYSRLMITRNSGRSWEIIRHPRDRASCGLAFSDELHGLWTTDGEMRKTDDGGASWSVIHVPDTSFDKRAPVLMFSPTMFSYVGANGSKVFSTTDRGASWSTWDLPRHSHLRWHRSGDHGIWAALREQHGSDVRSWILHSTDLGRTWTTSFDTTTNDANSICDVGFVNDSCGMAVFGKGLVRTTRDAGATWIAEPTPDALQGNLFEIHTLIATTPTSVYVINGLSGDVFRRRCSSTSRP